MVLVGISRNKVILGNTWRNQKKKVRNRIDFKFTEMLGYPFRGSALAESRGIPSG